VSGPARPGVGVLHPGAMGAAVGAALAARGEAVHWVSAGRSGATCARAAAAGLVEHRELAGMLAAVDTVISVCPPEAAVETARGVSALGFAGTYVDANAVAPATARRIGDLIEQAGGTFVDGAIVGGPPATRGETRLFLSGNAAATVAARFEGSPFETVVLGGDAGAASALKVAYAAWTKGSGALLLAVRAFARSNGVDAALLDEWARSQPRLADRSSGTARGNARKAWRFVAEMDEEADAFASSGLPDGFARAAARVYERLAGYKDIEDVDADAVFDALNRTT
jgi:3-hydroxyisobutyrate dehydrogenase-like beta-hydroxyacid dehydrogenase